MHDLEALYREHRAGLVRLVERELHDRHDAEDVVQTAFLDAQRALERGTILHNPRAWLAAIALNAARRLRRRHVSVEALEDYAVQEASRLPEIKAALAELPKSEQAAVVYRDVLGLSYAEMAVQIGTTVPAVTMLLHRARSRLRNVLGIALIGIQPWRWLRSGPGQAVAAKTAGVVVVAGGLATAGVVTARHAARATEPAGAGPTTAAPAAIRESARIAKRIGPVRRPERTGPAAVSPGPAAAQTTSHTSSRQPVPSAVPAPVSSLPSVRPPTVTGPSVSLPALTVPSTAAVVTTPVATVTVAVPPGPTITVPTPIATVTVSIP